MQRYVLTLGASSQAQAQRSPNVVVVMMDDLGTETSEATAHGTSERRTSIVSPAKACA